MKLDVLDLQWFQIAIAKLAWVWNDFIHIAMRP